MKKNYTLLLLILAMMMGRVEAQEYIKATTVMNSTSWNWWNNSCKQTTNWWEGTGNKNMAVDRHGNCYVVGNFWNTANVGGITINSTGCTTGGWTCTDFYIAKFDSAGQTQWVLSGGGNGQDGINSVAVDSAGNCYITGRAYGDVDFGPNITLNCQNQDAFFARISPTGTWDWAKKLGTGTSTDCGVGIAVDQLGNVYATGTFAGNILMSTNPAVWLTGNNNAVDAFVLKLRASDGKYLWARAGYGQGSDSYANDIITDTYGNVYIAGSYFNDMEFGSVKLNSPSTNGFVVKFDALGNPIWGKSLAKNINAITSDQSGNVIAGGVFSDTTVIGSDTLRPYSPLQNDIFLAKLDQSGNFVWGKMIGSQEPFNNFTWGDRQDFVNDIMLDEAENIYVLGTLSDSTFTGSTCDVKNIAGRHSNQWNWWWRRFPVLIKLNYKGECMWNAQAGYTDQNQWGCTWCNGFNGMGQDAFGNIYITGNWYAWWNTSREYGFYINNDTAEAGVISGGTTNNWWNTYIAKFRDREYIITEAVAQDAYCVGDSISVPFTTFGGFDTSNTFSVQLSDSAGGFGNPTIIGSLKTQTSDTIKCYLPTTLPGGQYYRVRVVADVPDVQGFISKTPFIVSPFPVADAGPNLLLCKGDTVAMNGDGGQDFEWTPQGPDMLDGSDYNAKVFPDQTKDYFMKVTNPGGCFDMDTVRIEVITRAVANTISDSSLCRGDSLQMTSSGGDTYSWSPSQGLSDSTIASPMVSPDSSRTYTLTVSNAACSDVAYVDITVKENPVVSAGSDATICLRDSVQLQGSGDASQYQWVNSTGLSSATVPDPNASPGFTTGYILRGTSSEGCITTDTVTVTVLSLPTITRPNDTAICPGSTLALQVSGGSSYQWTPNQGITGLLTQNNIMVSPDSNRIYTVTVSDGQCSDSTNIQVDLHPEPIANAGNDTSLCFGGTVQLEALGGIQYQWQDPNGDMDATFSAKPNVTPSQLLQNTYIVTITTLEGCVDNDTIEVTAHPLPIADAGADDAICPGLNTQLQASGGISYEWDADPTLNNPLQSSPTATPAVDTRYFVTVTDNQGCENRDSVLITIHPPVVPEAGADELICKGSDIQLQASGGVQYQWTPATYLNNVNQPDPTATPPQDITYKVKVTDANGCEGLDSMTVAVLPIPTANAGPDTYVCIGDEVTLEASGGDDYEWNNNEPTQRITVTPLTNTQYWVKTKSLNNCWSEYDTVNVEIKPLPNARFTAAPDKGIAPFDVNFLNNSSGATSYRWDFGDQIGTSSQTEPQYRFNTPGNYTVTLTAYSDFGCARQADIQVLVEEAFRMFVPTAFSPNNDGLNDKFELNHVGMKSMKGFIYNRWGELIYTWEVSEGQSPESIQWWDGTYEGSEVMGGVYLYAIEAVTIGNKKESIRGTVNLLD